MSSNTGLDRSGREGIVSVIRRTVLVMISLSAIESSLDTASQPED